MICSCKSKWYLEPLFKFFLDAVISVWNVPILKSQVNWQVLHCPFSPEDLLPVEYLWLCVYSTFQKTRPRTRTRVIWVCNCIPLTVFQFKSWISSFPTEKKCLLQKLSHSRCVINLHRVINLWWEFGLPVYIFKKYLRYTKSTQFEKCIIMNIPSVLENEHYRSEFLMHLLLFCQPPSFEADVSPFLLFLFIRSWIILVIIFKQKFKVTRKQIKWMLYFPKFHWIS